MFRALVVQTLEHKIPHRHTASRRSVPKRGRGMLLLPHPPLEKERTEPGQHHRACRGPQPKEQAARHHVFSARANIAQGIQEQAELIIVVS
jgi:hypothetical protein